MLGKEPKYGAYTELFAGLHPGVENGAFGMFMLMSLLIKQIERKKERKKEESWFSY